MMEQKDCSHARIAFADGDYHIVCQGCGAKWAMVNPSTLGEFAMPEAANKGVGASLSGKVRVAP
jgi:hypothetical protein